LQRRARVRFMVRSAGDSRTGRAKHAIERSEIHASEPNVGVTKAHSPALPDTCRPTLLPHCFALPVRGQAGPRSNRPATISLKIQFLRDPITLDPLTKRSSGHSQELSRFHLISFGALHRKNGELSLQPR
jgi:hypothetical protein